MYMHVYSLPVLLDPPPYYYMYCTCCYMYMHIYSLPILYLYMYAPYIGTHACTMYVYLVYSLQVHVCIQSGHIRIPSLYLSCVHSMLVHMHVHVFYMYMYMHVRFRCKLDYPCSL